MKKKKKKINKREREKEDCQIISTVKLFSTVNYHYRDNKRLQNKFDSNNINNLQIYMIHTHNIYIYIYVCICLFLYQRNNKYQKERIRKNSIH